MKLPTWFRRNPVDADMELANVPPSKWKSTLEAAPDKEAVEVIRGYIKDLKRNLETGKGLLLYGKVRSGKSCLAACIVREVASHGCDPYWMEAFKAIDAWRGEKNLTGLKMLHKSNCLVIDDFGMEGDSSYSRQLMDQILKYRLEREKATILTTNLLLERIEEVYGEKTSALFEEFLFPVPVMKKELTKDVKGVK
jgi:DNA replication protein DnaC